VKVVKMSDEHHWDWTRTRQELADMLDQLTPEQAFQIVRALCRVEDESHLAAVLSGQIRGQVARIDAERKRD
jgi:hypothetical protein